ncbi:MAG: polysaccharide biosynthesis/export family protein [Bacteroidales bacterium]
MKKILPVFSINQILFIVLIGAVLLNSCIPQRKLKYLQTKVEGDTLNEFVLKQRPKNIVRPFDNIYVKVISPDATTSAMFNSETMNLQIVNYNMISYTVNDSGYIVFPFVGLIRVKDLTILAAQDTIQKAISQYISEAAVIVKFVGKSITVVGEVFRQGEYVIYSDNINIFKAISLAGGMTDYGNREQVKIIREENGKAVINIVNLTDKHFLESQFYYLRPDDILVIDPYKQKAFGFAQFPYNLVMTGMTTIIAILAFMQTYQH